MKNIMLNENVVSDRGYHLSGMARRGTRQSQDLERDECTQRERPISGSAMKASATGMHQTTDTGQIVPRTRKGQQSNNCPSRQRERNTKEFQSK